MTAAEVGRVLKGRRTGEGWLCRCPVPSHGRGQGDRSPSLLVSDGDRQVLLHCFGGCDVRDILHELRQTGLVDQDREASRPAFASASMPAATRDPEALEIWRAGIPLDEGTLARRYLAEHRGLIPPWPPSLRASRGLRYPRAGVVLPALLAAVSGSDREILAVQATFLRINDGKKAPVTEPRWTFGHLGVGAVRLGPAGDILGLAEGVEDALAAMQLAAVPTWATLGAARMHRVAVPAEVREVHIFADDDEPGRLAAERAAERHTAEGRRVVIRLPPDGFKDWAEAAMESALA
jgi:hypothetical protein